MSRCGRCGEETDHERWLQLTSRESAAVREQRDDIPGEASLRLSLCRSCYLGFDKLRELQHGTDEEQSEKAWRQIEQIVTTAPRESLSDE